MSEGKIGGSEGALMPLLRPEKLRTVNVVVLITYIKLSIQTNQNFVSLSLHPTVPGSIVPLHSKRLFCCSSETGGGWTAGPFPSLSVRDKPQTIFTRVPTTHPKAAIRPQPKPQIYMQAHDVEQS